MAVEVKPFSPELLRSMREEKHFTHSDLSFYTCVSANTISRYERGLSTPSVKMWERIYTLLSREKVSKPPDTWQEVQEQFKYEPVTFTFTEGQCYSITDKKAKDTPSAAWNIDTMAVFRYKGKIGIHHCFSEINGGWHRTYTDAQLIGKKIKEVML